jgi:antitoxin FitA
LKIDGGFDIVDIKLETSMGDLLIRDLTPALRREIQERARKNRRSLSDEAKTLIQRGLSAPAPSGGLGTRLFSLVRDEDRGDDLVFKIPGEIREPPDFK